MNLGARLTAFSLSGMTEIVKATVNLLTRADDLISVWEDLGPGHRHFINAMESAVMRLDNATTDYCDSDESSTPANSLYMRANDFIVAWRTDPEGPEPDCALRDWDEIYYLSEAVKEMKTV